MKIKTLFIDIGGVLLSNGWDEAARQKAAIHFDLDFEKINSKHREIFGTYELGKISLKNYLQHTVFDEERSFSFEDFERFLLEQSKPFPEMINWLAEMRKIGRVKIFAVSNEGRELTQYRLERFGLKNLMDGFIVSSFVGLRKPDLDIYRLALDISQSSSDEVLYLDDRKLFVEIAQELNIQGICHVNRLETEKKIKELEINF